MNWAGVKRKEKEKNKQVKYVIICLSEICLYSVTVSECLHSVFVGLFYVLFLSFKSQLVFISITKLMVRFYVFSWSQM